MWIGSYVCLTDRNVNAFDGEQLVLLPHRQKIEIRPRSHEHTLRGIETADNLQPV